jgi:predicted glycogen debranching enzyme
MIRFDQSVSRDLSASTKREWLETNGLGGFASSTISGINTRRYHGLLVAATKPPVSRMVLLSKFEETLILDGRRYELSANRYPGVVHPQGYRYLKEFQQDPFPVFVYELEGVKLEKSIFMVYGENTTVVQYVFWGYGASSCSLELRPLIAFRDYHNTTHANGALNPAFEGSPGSLKITPYSVLPSLYLSHDGAVVQPGGDWYRNFEYDVERARGLDFQEDLFNPCVLAFDLNSNACPSIIASTEPHASSAAGSLRDCEIERRRALSEAAPVDLDFVRSLMIAADQFIVKRGNGSSVIAGYHWFSDWGRDTMIALPGLALATNRLDVARNILLAFAAHVDCGMLPNRFPDAGETPDYNTVDATLWFFEAVRALLEKTGNYEFVRQNLYAVLAEIVSWHECGTRYGIRVDSDGLLRAGEPGVQLTWMDAKIGDWVVTPRHGKPVEIQALWYNALRIMEMLAESYSYSSDRIRYAEMAGRVRNAFAPLFWNESQGCLFDVVDGDYRDGAVRPNQIFAVSLSHQLLSPRQSKQVVDVVEKHLLTPYGLRSLAPTDPSYRSRYDGDPRNRDSAYHQGTVWPWLLGPFLRAYLRVNGYSRAARAQAERWTEGLCRYVEDEGVGQLPEVFDGDPPHRAGGCVAQAWSVAELLRVFVENLYVGVSGESLLEGENVGNAGAAGDGAAIVAEGGFKS